MPDMTAPIKLDADIRNRYTGGPTCRATHLRTEAPGDEPSWTMDHLVFLVTEVRPRLEATVA